jgi:hypothetical protein
MNQDLFADPSGTGLLHTPMMQQYWAEASTNV